MSAGAVVGVDTSLTASGLASSHGWCRTVGYSDAKNPITKLPVRQRLTALEGVRADVLCAIGTPALAVMETAAYSRAGGGGHERGWLWWEVYGGLVRAGVPVALMDPRQRMLYATGKGNATKSAVVDAVARRWPAWETAGDDNQADGVVLMAAGLDWLGQPLVKMPATHRRALERAEWPERGAVSL